MITYIKNVVSLKLDVHICTGCNMCINVCPHNVFLLKEKRAYITNIDACMECGACQLNCPENAISVLSGVGCAAGIIQGYLKGTDPTCGCETDNCC
ncbi:MAG: 4Fe-4S binding protein [Bacteroidetes bacterium]|nr:4Fe-4S binding protein [Bacteroidota bacterium]MBL6942816.1 4Fe-4S binding protein [Bacteroidales bacterium]